VLYFVLARMKSKKVRKEKHPKAPEPSRGFGTLEPAGLSENRAPEVLKPVGIFFAFNGHEWNAFEVLGGGPNDDLAQVTAQYQSLLRTSDTSTFDFYEAAYRAILMSKRT
jgi:hypothetical protein